MFGRRITALIVALVFCAVEIGVPIPHFTLPADEDYPCRHHACGCLTAEICRTSCCCFPTKTVSSCCSSTQGNPDECDEAADTPAEEERGVDILVNALTCQGANSFWIHLGVDLSPPSKITGVVPYVSGERFVLPGESTPKGFDLEPEPPPPRA